MKPDEANPDFYAALAAAYRQAPGQVLSTALWKALKAPDGAQTTIKTEDGRASRLELRDQGCLLVHWQQARAANTLQEEFFQGLHFAVLHEDFLPAVPDGLFPSRRPYFKLVWRAGKESRDTETWAASLPPGFSWQPVDPVEEAGQVAEVIRRCYPDIHPSPHTVMGWTRHPVYDPTLWLWVVDENTRQPAGLGIAELDPSIREGALEWIQVLPEYQGRGLGRALVLALLQSLQARADFVTVSGEADSPSQPEALYRRCGFSGRDRWWVLAQP